MPENEVAGLTPGIIIGEATSVDELFPRAEVVDQVAPVAQVETETQKEEEVKETWFCADCNNEQEAEAKDFQNDKGGYICEECREHYYSCDDCSRIIQEDEIVSVGDGDGIICDRCYSSDYCSCDDCGYVMRLDDSNGCDCDHTFCNRCYDNHGCNARDNDFSTRNYADTPLYGANEGEIIKIPRLIGVEIEAVGGNGYTASDDLPSYIGVSGDGSLESDEGACIEIQTPPASLQKAEEIIDTSTRVLRDAGFDVNKSCGLHVHIDSKDFENNGKKIANLVNTYYAVEPIIFAMLPESRRKNRYAKPLAEEGFIDEVSFSDLIEMRRVAKVTIEKKWYKKTHRLLLEKEKREHYHDSRYHGFNLHSLLANGHLELRYHNGTLDPTKIKNWIQFNLELMEWALGSYKKEKVYKIYRELDLTEKIKRVAYDVGLSENSKNYMVERLKKFHSLPTEITI